MRVSRQSEDVSQAARVDGLLREPLSDWLASATADEDVPLCVDLDGTLVKCDTLHDGLLRLLRQDRSGLLRVLWALLRDRAWGKQLMAERDAAHGRQLEVQSLPWNHAVLRYLRQEKSRGRRLVLATGADRRVAEQVAAHLGCFDAVVASEHGRNMTGQRKLEALRQRYGRFDYVGNSGEDAVLLQAARVAVVANPTARLRARMKTGRLCVAATLSERVPLRQSLPQALRLHQWVKNLLLVVPLLLSHRAALGQGLAAVVAFVAFGCMASACYVWNDLLDVESDRRHGSKRRRPFAAGELGLPEGVMLMATLLTAAFGLCLQLPGSFALWLCGYGAVTTVYSLWLKRVAIADVLVLAGLYTLRLFAGGAATGTAISAWLSTFAIFFFLSLALVKRVQELETLRQREGAAIPGRGYRVTDLELIRSLGVAAAVAALVILALYVRDPGATTLYAHPGRLWMLLPLQGFWLLRMWMLASRGLLEDDPVLFTLRDRVSVWLAAATVAVVLAASLQR